MSDIQDMNKRVDPMFLSLVKTHGFNERARVVAEDMLAKQKTVYSFRYRERVEEERNATRDWLLLSGQEQVEPIDRTTVQQILELVGSEKGFSVSELKSNRRHGKLVLARQIAMYLAKMLTTHSYPSLGRTFGGKDHTTILHGVRKIERMMAESPEFAEEVNAMRAKLEGGN